MSPNSALSCDQLFRACDPDRLGFATTADLEPAQPSEDKGIDNHPIADQLRTVLGFSERLRSSESRALVPDRGHVSGESGTSIK